MSWLNKFVTIEPAEETPPKVPAATSAPAGKPTVATPTLGSPALRSAMDLSIDEVLARGGAAQGRNSAETLLKLREGLAAFPPEQQLAMIRAMDATDDTWDEATVLSDAQRRIQILTAHLTAVDQDETTQIQRVQAGTTQALAANEQALKDVDRQIAELQAQRETLIRNASIGQTKANGDIEAVRIRATGIRNTISAVASQYQGIMRFFGK